MSADSVLADGRFAMRQRPKIKVLDFGGRRAIPGLNDNHL
jgi:predicted amidohydrolase YtcJ